MHSRRDVIRAGLSAALAAVLPKPARHIAHAGHSAEPDLKYFDAALGAARWLRATAIASPTGTSWPAVPPDATTVQHNLYTGFPGVVLFFIELSRATGDAAWLDLATSGADQLAAALPDEKAGDESTGLYTGLAGIAYTLEEADRARGESRYRAAILKARSTIVAGGRDVGAGVEWNDSTDIISGSAGTGLYLLRASRTFGSVDALKAAILAGRRLIEREFRNGDTSFWMASSASRVTCLTSRTAPRVSRISWRRSGRKRERNRSSMRRFVAPGTCSRSRRQPMVTAAGSFTTIRTDTSCST